jgi:hypothetical protein
MSEQTFKESFKVTDAQLAPPLAAIGALAALLNDCSIEVERTVDSAGHPGTKDTSAVA